MACTGLYYTSLTPLGSCSFEYSGGCIDFYPVTNVTKMYPDIEDAGRSREAFTSLKSELLPNGLFLIIFPKHKNFLKDQFFSGVFLGSADYTSTIVDEHGEVKLEFYGKGVVDADLPKDTFIKSVFMHGQSDLILETIELELPLADNSSKDINDAENEIHLGDSIFYFHHWIHGTSEWGAFA